MRYTPLLLAMLAVSVQLQAQAPWDIRDPGLQQPVKCRECLATLGQKPKEVQFGLYADENGDVFFIVTQHAFYQQLVRRSGDGFAVDVIDMDRYTCDKDPAPQTGFHKGHLLRPVYRAELERSKQVAPTGEVLLPLGHLPPTLAGRTVELNLLVIQDHNACYYNSFYDLATYRWELLDMGLYLDTLTFHAREDSAGRGAARSLLRSKALHFTIPFAKGRSTYSASDLQPLYDSLRLTDFDIRSMDIQAYSSVEGPEQRNLELQEERARSIVAALQSFQGPSIITTVNAGENWVEFVRDVASTSHAELATMPKDQVKERLKDRALADALEPMLARHRKAVVTLGLERRRELGEMPVEQLTSDLEKAIDERNVDRAMQLQNEVFSRVLDNSLPNDALSDIEVPQRKEFVPLLNARSAFRHFLDVSDAASTYADLKELERLAPDDGRIKYNLCVVAFDLWMNDAPVVPPAQLERNIQALRSHGIEERLVKRMLINFNILMAELYMTQGEYARKDECIKTIYRSYRSIDLDDADLLSVAQYFSSFANFDLAEKVCAARIVDIAVDRDLLFYYLNLTIVDEETTRKPEYRRVMLNAIARDRPRFCRLFAPFGEGGVTFQLLENSYLRKAWCENCRGVYRQ